MTTINKSKRSGGKLQAQINTYANSMYSENLELYPQVVAPPRTKQLKVLFLNTFKTIVVSINYSIIKRSRSYFNINRSPLS